VAWRAVAAVRAQLQDPDGMLRSVSLERLVEQCRLQPSPPGWAAQFQERYLDLSPIADHFAVPTTPKGQPVVPLGTVVSARPSGWVRKGHPDGPQLDGIPDVVSGPYGDGWSTSRTMAATTSSTSSAVWTWTRPHRDHR